MMLSVFGERTYKKINHESSDFRVLHGQGIFLSLYGNWPAIKNTIKYVILAYHITFIKRKLITDTYILFVKSSTTEPPLLCGDEKISPCLLVLAKQCTGCCAASIVLTDIYLHRLFVDKREDRSKVTSEFLVSLRIMVSLHGVRKIFFRGQWKYAFVWVVVWCDISSSNKTSSFHSRKWSENDSPR